MRKERLKTDVNRANKELAYYQEKAELARQLNKIEERRAKKMGKHDKSDDGQANDENDYVNSDGDGYDKVIKKKKINNLRKQMDYH